MNQNDLIKMANAMQKERNNIIDSLNIDATRFEKDFNEVFTYGASFRQVSFNGDEIQTKSIRTDQVLIDHGVSIHDF